ncbi:MAG TPA: hypothetical protein VF008_28565 [Niastella sp.]
MKKIFTLIAVLFSITTFAAGNPGPKTSKIAISNSGRSMMQVKIDGAMYDLGSSLALENIRSGNHTITIYKTESMGFRKRTQVVYNSTMFVAPAQLVNIDINRSGNIVVKTTSTDRFDRNNNNKGNNRNNNGRYENGRDDRNSNTRDDRYGRY